MQQDKLAYALSIIMVGIGNAEFEDTYLSFACGLN
jgi:hypothetical protein